MSAWRRSLPILPSFPCTSSAALLRGSTAGAAAVPCWNTYHYRRSRTALRKRVILFSRSIFDRYICFLLRSYHTIEAEGKYSPKMQQISIFYFTSLAFSCYTLLAKRSLALFLFVNFFGRCFQWLLFLSNKMLSSLKTLQNVKKLEMHCRATKKPSLI